MSVPAFSIRECLPADAEALAELSLRGLGYDYPADALAENLRRILRRESDRILVAEVDGAAAGYIHGCDYEVLYAPPMKNILGIAVAEAYRGHGIGRALLREIERWAKESGAAGVRLCSGAARTGAHEFYRRCGYGGEKGQLNFKKMF